MEDPWHSTPPTSGTRLGSETGITPPLAASHGEGWTPPSVTTLLLYLISPGMVKPPCEFLSGQTACSPLRDRRMRILSDDVRRRPPFFFIEFFGSSFDSVKSGLYGCSGRRKPRIRQWRRNRSTTVWTRFQNGQSCQSKDLTNTAQGR